MRMNGEETPKRFDLEERTFAFAKRSGGFVKRLAKTTGNVEGARQLVRSSGSVGANYIEANESLSKKGLCSSNQDLPERSKGKSLLAAINRNDGRYRRGRARPSRTGSAGIDEHFRRDRA